MVRVVDYLVSKLVWRGDGRVAGSQGRRVAGPGWAGCAGCECLSVSRGWAKWIGANEAANGTGGSGSLRGSLGNLGRRLQHCVELVPVPTTDLRLEITRKGPLRCVGCLPPAFENVSPNLRWKPSKPSKPSKHSRASTHRHRTRSPCCCPLLAGRMNVLPQYLESSCQSQPYRTTAHDTPSITWAASQPAGGQSTQTRTATYWPTTTVIVRHQQGSKQV